MDILCARSASVDESVFRLAIIEPRAYDNMDPQKIADVDIVLVSTSRTSFEAQIQDAKL